MSRLVDCVVLKQQAEGMDALPYPNELGQRIYETVSKEGWKQWMERAITIINENGLSTADEKSVELLEQHMLGFLFGENELGAPPPGFSAGGGAPAKK